jgi:hypothetical protein
MEPVSTRWSRHDVGITGERSWEPVALIISLLLTSCAVQRPAAQTARSETQPEEVTQVTLPRSGYVYDVAVADRAAWVTTESGLFRVDLVTTEAVNALSHDYLFRVAAGHGAVWITTGGDGHVLRVDPASAKVTARIDVRAGPVTDLAISNDAVWVSATSDVVRLDPKTNEIVARFQNKAGFGDIGSGGAGLWVIAGANAEGEVWQIDPGSNTVEQRVPLANPSFWNEIAVGDHAVWVTSSPIVHQPGAALVHLHRVDPSTGGITADIALGPGPAELGPGEGAVSYSGLALDEGSVWVLVNWDELLFSVDAGDLSVSERGDGLDCCSSGLGPGVAIGAGSVWITARSAITRVILQT